MEGDFSSLVMGFPRAFRTPTALEDADKTPNHLGGRVNRNSPDSAHCGDIFKGLAHKRRETLSVAHGLKSVLVRKGAVVDGQLNGVTGGEFKKPERGEFGFEHGHFRSMEERVSSPGETSEIVRGAAKLMQV